MKKFISITFLSIIFLFDFGNLFNCIKSCKAQDNTSLYKKAFSPHVYFGGKLGIALTSGDMKETWNNGIGGSGIAGYQLKQNVSFEGEFNLFLHTPKEDKNKMIDPWTYDEIEVFKTTGYFGLLMSVKYSLLPISKSNLSPFISFGAGFQMFMWDLTDEAWFATGMESTDGVYASVISASIGSDYQVSDNLSFVANIRYVYHIWSDELMESKNPIDFEGNSFILTVGGALHF